MVRQPSLDIDSCTALHCADEITYAIGSTYSSLLPSKRFPFSVFPVPDCQVRSQLHDPLGIDSPSTYMLHTTYLGSATLQHHASTVSPQLSIQSMPLIALP